MPAIPSWLLEPLWDQFAALLPDRPVYHPSRDIDQKRKTTDYRHLRPELVDDVPEIAVVRLSRTTALRGYVT